MELDPYIISLVKEDCLVQAGYSDWYLDLMPAAKVELLYYLHIKHGKKIKGILKSKKMI